MCFVLAFFHFCMAYFFMMLWYNDRCFGCRWSKTNFLCLMNVPLHRNRFSLLSCTCFVLLFFIITFPFFLKFFCHHVNFSYNAHFIQWNSIETSYSAFVSFHNIFSSFLSFLFRNTFYWWQFTLFLSLLDHFIVIRWRPVYSVYVHINSFRMSMMIMMMMPLSCWKRCMHVCVWVCVSRVYP